MPAKRVLIVHNYPKTGHGSVGTVLEEAGAAVQTLMAHEGEPLPRDADGHDALVVLGGGQNAMDDAGYPYFPALLDLIRDFERRDRAVLGICLGSQLMARAFGGENRIGGATEFGWTPVARTGEGEADPLLSALPARFPIFQWHDDTFTLPPGAAHLAESETAANQAFRVGRAAYAFQFHFEADRALVRLWSDEFRDWLAENKPGWAERHDEEAARLGPAADAVGLALARAWMALV